MDIKNISLLANEFQIEGHFKSAQSFGEGHINSTFLVETCCNKYILQKINDVVFSNVEELMNNIERVTTFIASKGVETLKFIPSKNGKLFIKTKYGFFRMMEFVKDTITYQEPVNLGFVASQGEAFGGLHQILSDFPIEDIKEIIPDFHNTKLRYIAFKDAIKSVSSNKLKSVENEIGFIKEHEKDYSVIVEGIKNGTIKTRIIHNDAKFNNILFDKNTNKCRLIIDLDTIMPGSILYDVGDAIRGLFTGNNEESKDLSLLRTNFDIFKAFTYAYLDKMKDELTATEIKLIPFSAFLISAELGMRFLQDYLTGNKYFHADYEEQNLIRARTQLTLAKDIYENLDTLNKLVGDYKHGEQY